MKNKNRLLLYRLLSESLVSEQKEKKEKKPSALEGSVLDVDTDNSLSQGRPPARVTDSREMAADPSKAKELLKTLGARSGGSKWTDKIGSLLSSASDHEDFGKLVSDVQDGVVNPSKSKEGVLIKCHSGPVSDDPKAAYFFIRSLYTAAINSGEMSLDRKDEKQIRIEKAGQSDFLFYKGKAKSWKS